MKADGATQIATERRRQVLQEGWSADHDDQVHENGDLAKAAVCYVLFSDQKGAPVNWPWEDESWKPDPDRIRTLVKAGALIAAEIDRLMRQVDGP